MGEGLDPASTGSADDDDFYLALVVSPELDPDSAVIGDSARPLVFYQLTGVSQTLKLSFGKISRVGDDLVIEARPVQGF